jgi:integrase
MGTVSNIGTKDRPQWYCRYVDADGKRKHRPTKQTTKAAALRFVAEIEARVARGLIGIPEVSEDEQKAKALTVGELAQRFLKEYNPPQLKDQARYMSNAGPTVKARLLPYPLASMAAMEVRKLHVIQYRDALRETYKPSTINTTMSTLSKIFVWAIDSEIIPDRRNPCSRIGKMRAAPLEQRYSREECARLLGPQADPKIATALLTGMRHGELCGLRWSDVRFDLSCIEINRSFRSTPKSGKARTIPLHSDLAPILRAWQANCPETPEGLVFPVSSGGNTYRLGQRQDGCDVRSLLSAAGVPSDHLHPWHAMRHTFATLLAESGASFDAITRILGHASAGSRVTAGYVHTSLTYLAGELAKLRLVPGQPANVLRIEAYRATA